MNLASYFAPQNRTRLYIRSFARFKALYLSCTRGVLFGYGNDSRMFCLCACIWEQEDDRERQI